MIAALTWFRSGPELLAWLGQIAPFYGAAMEIAVPLLIWVAALAGGGASKAAGRNPSGTARGTRPAA